MTVTILPEKDRMLPEDLGKVNLKDIGKILATLQKSIIEQLLPEGGSDCIIYQKGYVFTVSK